MGRNIIGVGLRGSLDEKNSDREVWEDGIEVDGKMIDIERKQTWAECLVGATKYDD